jgi:hypothetical protein
VSLNNYRYQYFCKGINILPVDGDTRLISPTLPQFIRGVQSFESSQDIPLIDVVGQEGFLQVSSKRSISIDIERVIKTSGDFFIKKDSALATELSANGGRAVSFNVILIYGSEDKEFLDDTAINFKQMYKHCHITGLSYSLSLSAPSIVEKLSMAGVDIETNELYIPAIQVPGEVENAPLFNRSMFSPTHASINPSVLPALVTDLIENYGDGTIYTGLQDVEIAISFPYKSLIDEGTWNLNNPNKYILAAFPIRVSTTFRVNTKRVHAGDQLLSNPISLDDTISINYGNFRFNLGGKNKMSSVSVNGGDVDGPVDQIEISYENFNAFKIEGI